VTLAARRRIALLINSMNYGGAETQVAVLANGLARLGHSVSLIVFYAGGMLRGNVSSDVRVRCLGRRGRWDVIGVLRSLFSTLDEERPDVLYAFLPGPNIMASLAGLRSSKLKVTWGVRASDVDLSHYSWAARWSYLLERRFSRFPDLIISNSAAGRQHAVAHGFPDKKHFIVIPNGIDVERFGADAGVGDALRAQWGISRSHALIGIVARLDPMKDHGNFLEAAAKLVESRPEFRFVSVGAGPEEYAAALRERARSLGLEEKMIWAGPRGDLPAVYNALDLLVSSSAFGEGFSNVLGEAMACGVPCVATDVGDAREVLGDTGVIVPRRDAQALAEAMTKELERVRIEGPRLRASLRQRIVENFSVPKLVQRTAEAIETIPALRGRALPSVVEQS